MVRYCAVYGCLETNYSNKNRKFFRFPSDEQRCKYWLKAIDRLDLLEKGLKTLHSSYFVCDTHFANSDRTKRVLKKNAVPTLLLPQSEDPSGTSKYTQTDENLFPCSSTSSQSPNVKKRKLLESLTENAKEPNMPPLLKKVVDAQKLLERKFQGNEHKDNIMFALNVYFANPVAYRLYSEVLCLPNMKTLQRGIANDISTKLNENIIKSLQSKSRNMSESEKYCILCADEISLKTHLHYQINKDKVVGFHEIEENQSKEIATAAFVVMARGIFTNWKQPLAFCFLGESKNYAELNTWLENIISTTIEIGFNVCALTTNLESKSIAKNEAISLNQPYFFVKGKKIYRIFDVPHLMKSLRNNLINYNCAYKDEDDSQQVASWDDVEKMYDLEKDKKYRMTSKLTESHIKPNNFEKMQVKYATQVLSRTVAVSIGALVEEGKLSENCLGTTKLIELINDTFDILNSSRVSDDYKYKRAFHHADYQTSTLEKAYCIFSELRVINRSNGKDVTDTVKSIKGLLTSIKAISCLASDLKTAGYDCLFTRRLNLDVFKNFFAKVRQRSGNYEPTAIQFLIAFKKLFFVNIIRNSQYANCTEKLHQLLISVQERISMSSEQKLSTESMIMPLQVGTYDYRFDLPEENTFNYVCGYLLEKCFERHKSCELMRNYIKSLQQLNESNIFILLKASSTNQPFGALINPPEIFKQYIKQINTICEDHWKNFNFYHVGNEILPKINEIVFNLPCPCFPIEFLNKLFVRFRIFNAIRFNNKSLRDKSSKRKCFTVNYL